MPSIMNGLCIAFCWGLADVQSSRTNFPAMKISVIAQGFGFLMLTVVGIIWFHTTVSPNLSFVTGTGLELLFFLGLLSALAYFCLYRALHHARTTSIGTISTIIAANAGVTVLLSCFVTTPDMGQISVVGIMISGVLILTRNAAPPITSANQSLLPPGILWAFAASLCLGTFNFGVGMLEQNTAMSMTNTFLMLLAIRAFSFLVLALVLAMSPSLPERPDQHRPHNLFRAASTGILEAIGLILFSFSTHTTNVGLVAALASCSILVPLGYGFLVQRDTLSVSRIGGIGLLFIGLLRLSYPALSSEIVFFWTLFCFSLALFPSIAHLLSPWLHTFRHLLFSSLYIGTSSPAMETYPTIEIRQIHGIVRIQTRPTPQMHVQKRQHPSRSTYQRHPPAKNVPDTPRIRQERQPQTLSGSDGLSFWMLLPFLIVLTFLTIIVGLTIFSSF